MRIGLGTAAVLVVLGGLVPGGVVAQGTKLWTVSRYDEMERGTTDGVAIRSDGKLVSAPKFDSFADPNLAYVWSMRMDSHGHLYAAGGSTAKVLRFDDSGNATTVFESAELAAQHNSRLILQHVIKPQEAREVLAGRTIADVEHDLLTLVPDEFRGRIQVQAVVVPGDPTEELLYQSRAQQADLVVLGAQGASAFAAITRHGVVYKVLAHSHVPVMTLSPVVLEHCGATGERPTAVEHFLAGVF